MKTIENNVYEITSEFAIRIVKLYKYLTEEKHEYIMSKQLFRSETSIGANSFEGKNAQSRADFNSKMNIALKEATESGFWIDTKPNIWMRHNTNLSTTIGIKSWVY